MFIVNLVCRNTSLRGEVLSDLYSVFPELYSIHIEGEVNEVVMALPKPRYKADKSIDGSWEALKTVFRNLVDELQKLAKKQGHPWDPSLDLCELVENIKIV